MANPKSPKYANVPNAEAILAQPYKESLTDKALEKTFMGVAKKEFESTVEFGMRCARRCGNMYTASLYGGLASLLASVEPAELKGKRISMFAFGSGLASSFFTIKVRGDVSEIREKMDLVRRLESMKLVPCQEYVDALTVSPFGDFGGCMRGVLIRGRLAAPREEPQRGIVRAGGLAREHLARRLLPREHRQQVPPQVRAQGVSALCFLVLRVFPCFLFPLRTRILLRPSSSSSLCRLLSSTLFAYIIHSRSRTTPHHTIRTLIAPPHLVYRRPARPFVAPVGVEERSF